MNDYTVPVIVDLGKQKKRPLRALKQGRGRLMAEVLQVVEDVRSGLGEERDTKLLIPIVVVYKRKSRRQGGLFG